MGTSHQNPMMEITTRHENGQAGVVLSGQGDSVSAPSHATGRGKQLRQIEWEVRER